MNRENLNRIRNLISKGQINDAIECFSHDETNQEILSLKARLNILVDKKVKGIISYEQEKIETNQIIDSLLLLTNKFEKEKPVKPKLKVDKQLIELIKEKLVLTLKFYYTISAVLIFAGIVIAIILHLHDSLETAEGIGSMLISSLSGFSIREIINRKERIAFLEILITKFDSFSEEFEIEKVKNISWSIIESTILKSHQNGK